jgi:hypothetical protein
MSNFPADKKFGDDTDDLPAGLEYGVGYGTH